MLLGLIMLIIAGLHERLERHERQRLDVSNMQHPLKRQFPQFAL